MAAYSDIGQANLDALDGAKRFTAWMYEQVRPYLAGPIFEIGSGTGTYSRMVLRDFPGEQVLLSDIDPRYVAHLTQEFGSDHVTAQVLDLGNQEHFAEVRGTYESAFALNVLEHIEDDVEAMRNVRSTLKPGGVFVVLVPAHKFLYNCIDEGVGHYRRYTRAELVEKAERAGFTVRKVWYFNMLSIPGWYINGNVMKNPIISSGLVGLYDRLIPMVRLIERYVLRQSIGISLIAVLQNDSPSGAV